MTRSFHHRDKYSNNYYCQSRPEIWSLIPNNANKILDIGCGGGGLCADVKKQRNVWYCGIDISLEAIDYAKEVLDEVHLGDISSMDLPYSYEYFDTLIFADILEHVAYPLDTLRRWLPLLKANGCVLISLPNVRHFTVTIPLIFFGKWEYSDRGILDRTHLRFFTRESARKLIYDAGLQIEQELPKGLSKYNCYKHARGDME